MDEQKHDAARKPQSPEEVVQVVQDGIDLTHLHTDPTTSASGQGQNIHMDALSLAELEQFHLPENHEFRALHRTMSPDEAALSRAIKDQAYLLHSLLRLVKHAEDAQRAAVKLKECVMWGIHGITE